MPVLMLKSAGEMQIPSSCRHIPARAGWLTVTRGSLFWVAIPVVSEDPVVWGCIRDVAS
jgi:hypothetical protein